MRSKEEIEERKKKKKRLLEHLEEEKIYYDYDYYDYCYTVRIFRLSSTTVPRDKIEAPYILFFTYY